MYRRPANTPHEVLTRTLAEGATRAASSGTDHTALWGALSDATQGGKRFRPALVLAAHEAFGAPHPAAAAEVAAAVEVLHTAFVIHDDVIDGDDVRRGRPNVAGRFAGRANELGAPDVEAGHFGATAAILAGDLALATAVRTVATCFAPRTTVHRLLDLFDEALHATAAGELADVRYAMGVEEVTLGDVLRMAELKTGAYSFQLPLQAGAILAGAGDDVIERLGEAGRLLGIAFQLNDDLLGVFGDPAITGKSALCDLREGKQTALVAHARTTEMWPQLSLLVGRSDLTEAQGAEACVLLERAGSRRFVSDLALDHLGRALALLDVLGMPDSLLTVVAELGGDVARSAA